jgi:hypothetical protein
MYCYYYRTKFGTFWIKPDPSLKNRWCLYIDNECLGNYHSPEAAAGDVYMGTTGHYEWDCQDSVAEATDLSEWELGEPDDL